MPCGAWIPWVHCGARIPWYPGGAWMPWWPWCPGSLWRSDSLRCVGTLRQNALVPWVPWVPWCPGCPGRLGAWPAACGLTSMFPGACLSRCPGCLFLGGPVALAPTSRLDDATWLSDRGCPLIVLTAHLAVLLRGGSCTGEEEYRKGDQRREHG